MSFGDLVPSRVFVCSFRCLQGSNNDIAENTDAQFPGYVIRSDSRQIYKLCLYI